MTGGVGRFVGFRNLKMGSEFSWNTYTEVVASQQKQLQQQQQLVGPCGKKERSFSGDRTNPYPLKSGIVSLAPFA